MKSEIIEKIYIEVSKGINDDWYTSDKPYWYNYVVNLDLSLRVTYLTALLENQINNGGFLQYFSNEYGQFALETIDALIEVDAYRKSGLLERALNIVKEENISEEDFRKGLLNKTLKKLFENDDLYEPLGKLDDRYYQIQSEDMTVLLERFLGKECSKI